MDDLVHRRLRKQARRNIGRDGAIVVGRDEALRNDEVADAQARRHRLREGRRERDTFATLELMDPRDRLAVVPHPAVWVVLENGEVILGRELDEPSAALGADRPARRILERRDRVEERDRPAATQFCLEPIEVEAFVVHRERNNLHAVARENLQRAVVRRTLDEHATGAACKLHGGVEHEALQATGRNEDAIRGDAVPLGEQLPQRCVSAAGSVRENRPPVPRERRARTVGDQRRIEALRGRGSAGERDRCHDLSVAGWTAPLAWEPAWASNMRATATVVNRESAQCRPGRSASFDSRLEHGSRWKVRG